MHSGENLKMKKFNVGIKGIVRDERGLLLLKKTKGAHNQMIWEMPGGRIDGDEDFSDTLKRELIEELPGIEVVAVQELRGAHRLKKDIDDDISLVLLYFLVDAKLPDKIVLSEEHESYMWVSNANDVPKELNPEIDRVLRELLI